MGLRAFQWPHRLLLLRHVNNTAAAFPNLLEQLVAADSVAGFFRRRQSQRNHSDVTWRHCGRAFKESARFFASLKKFFDPLTQPGFTGAGVVKIRRAVVGGQPARSTENGKFVIRRIDHDGSRGGSYCNHQCEKPE
jgi:hypothetical protein